MFLTQHPSLSDQESSPHVFERLSSDKSIPMPFFLFESSTSFIVPNQPCKKHPVLCHNCHTLATNPSKSPNICRPFGCRLVGHCIAYEWAIHTTNTELLSAEHFPNAIKPSRNATKPPSKRHQNPPPNSTHIFP